MEGKQAWSVAAVIRMRIVYWINNRVTWRLLMTKRYKLSYVALKKYCVSKLPISESDTQRDVHTHQPKATLSGLGHLFVASQSSEGGNMTSGVIFARYFDCTALSKYHLFKLSQANTKKATQKKPNSTTSQ